MKFQYLVEQLLEETIKEWQMFAYGNLPLSPSILKRLNLINVKKKNSHEYHHVTDLANIKNIIKIQNKSNSISTIETWDPDVLGGVKTDGGIVFKLIGNPLFAANADCWSTADRNGMRWLNFNNAIASEERPKQVMKIQNKLTTIYANVLAELIDEPIKTTQDMLRILDDKDGKFKAKFIKECFDALEKYLNPMTLMDIKNLYNEDDSRYEETVLNKIKIISMYIININGNVSLEQAKHISKGMKFDVKYIDMESEDLDMFDLGDLDEYAININ